MLASRQLSRNFCQCHSPDRPLTSHPRALWLVQRLSCPGSNSTPYGRVRWARAGCPPSFFFFSFPLPSPCTIAIYVCSLDTDSRTHNTCLSQGRQCAGRSTANNAQRLRDTHRLDFGLPLPLMRQVRHALWKMSFGAVKIVPSTREAFAETLKIASKRAGLRAQ